MRILDQNGHEIQEVDVNYDLGYLVEEPIFVRHHEAIEAVEEEGHWEVIAEYPNGGKDVDWIIDVEAVVAADAWDEYEDIMRYILYTEAELAEREEERRKMEEEQARYAALLENGVTWEDLAKALAEGVNSI